MTDLFIVRCDSDPLRDSRALRAFFNEAEAVEFLDSVQEIALSLFEYNEIRSKKYSILRRYTPEMLKEHPLDKDYDEHSSDVNYFIEVVACVDA